MENVYKMFLDFITLYQRLVVLHGFGKYRDNIRVIGINFLRGESSDVKAFGFGNNKNMSKTSSIKTSFG